MKQVNFGCIQTMHKFSNKFYFIIKGVLIIIFVPDVVFSIFLLPPLGVRHKNGGGGNEEQKSGPSQKHHIPGPVLIFVLIIVIVGSVVIIIGVLISVRIAVLLWSHPYIHDGQDEDTN
ncbi:ORF438 [White spot syndrome virus]|uniref:Wsv413 n=3 Tax=White spot syndrome virus TaxID=342409 RepID=Q8VAJ5_WSSVS|nr:wsv413 [Shrimp white spot syndrome virus]AFX59790.1 wsv413 [White spot syndrome virus]AAL33415.1 wsv413 [Shrimp white spot syndrome virus]AAL89340.1 WSSV472 [Shrimp white spot syndrome virus]ATU83576.1 ORF438 [White spot syndrome virus]AWQ60537.1 wsv413 [Shrimp white spot syndrome virus]